MAEIKVSSDVLRNASQNLTTYGTQFTALMGEIKSGMQRMKNEWQGDAADEFINKFNSLDRTFDTYTRVINEYAKFLENAAEQYETADTSVQNDTSNLQNNLFS